MACDILMLDSLRLYEGVAYREDITRVDGSRG